MLTVYMMVESMYVFCGIVSGGIRKSLSRYNKSPEGWGEDTGSLAGERLEVPGSLPRSTSARRSTYNIISSSYIMCGRS